MQHLDTTISDSTEKLRCASDPDPGDAAAGLIGRPAFRGSLEPAYLRRVR
jgi:hypothetical protein